MSVTRTDFLAIVVALLHVAVGFGLLWWLGAPGWALAAWLLLNTRVKLISRRGRN